MFHNVTFMCVCAIVNKPHLHKTNFGEQNKYLQIIYWTYIILLNSLLDELWLYQKEHNYDAIFQQETNFTQNNMTLGPFKHWKNKMFTHYKEKTMGFGVGTLIPNDIKNVFREDFSNDSLELLWNEIEIQGQQILIGNMYIPPNMESQLHIEQRTWETEKKNWFY